MFVQFLENGGAENYFKKRKRLNGSGENRLKKRPHGWVQKYFLFLRFILLQDFQGSYSILEIQYISTGNLRMPTNSGKLLEI